MRGGAGHVDVLVSNCGSRFSYNIVRSLGRSGLKVAVGQDPASGIARFSRYAAARFRHPPFHRDGSGFISTLTAAIERYRPDVYIPADEEIYLVARHRADFDALDVSVPISHSAVLERLHDKSSSVALARSLDIPTPDTSVPMTMHAVHDFAHRHGGRLVLKVTRRLKAESRMVTSGVWWIAASELPERLEHIMAEHSFGFGDFLVQEGVPGRGYGVSVLMNSGRIRGRFVHRRLRERVLTGGPSTLRESTTHARLEEYAERLLSEVEFHGVAMVEFRVDEETGQVWFIEVNPRFWGSLALAIQAGVDFPLLLYLMARDGDVDPVLSYKSGVVVRWLAGDAAALFKQILVAHRWPGWQAIFARADGYDDVHADDLWPFVAELVLPAHRLLRRRRSPPAPA
jgi:predicted ATP-grasp superfamily ATP-dependent carboligase